MKKRIVLIIAILAIGVAAILATDQLESISHQNTSAEPNSRYTDEVIERVVGGHTVFVPKEYLKFRTSSVGTRSMLIHAWYPGAAPPPSGDSFDLRENQGIWWKNISILATTGIHPTKTFDTFARQTTEHLSATVYVGEEHGLQHFTQEADGNPDAKDIWFEKSSDEIKSFIRCSDKITDLSVPQCEHVLWFARDYRIHINYNRKLLPQWKVIRSNVLAMLDSFSSRASSTQFIQNQISQAKYASSTQEINSLALQSEKNTIEGEQFKINIGGVKFRVPAHYNDGDAAGSMRDKTLLLRYILPDFQSLSKLEGTSKYKEAWSQKRLGQAFISGSDNKTEFNKLFELRRGNRTDIAHYETEEFTGPDGLRAEHWFRVYTGGPKVGKREHKKDYFFELDESERILSFIECHPVEYEAIKFRPRCTHTFIQNGLYYKISYSRDKYLYSWSYQRETTIDFINKFISRN